jgi:LuxR family maltose regulon positive regulatory protein
MEGCVHLHTNELEEAIQPFTFAAQQRHAIDTAALIDALAGLSLVQQLNGVVDEAAITMEQLLQLAQELNEPLYLSVAHSCQARIALLQGNLALAVQWAQEERPIPSPAELFLWLEVPAITRARVLVADGSEESLLKAGELLGDIREQSERCFFTNQTIEVAVLQSLALEKQGRSAEAAQVLSDTLALALPGTWIRPFVELGSPMADLLQRLKRQGTDDEMSSYIDLILAAFPALVPGHQLQLNDPLTDRELHVLRLLSTKLSAREIADELVVTVYTVRMHTKNIYSKLDVHSRVEAIEHARELKLI